MTRDDFPAGIAAPARRALLQAGYTGLDQLTKTTEKELLALHGMGAKGVRLLREALAARGASFAPEEEVPGSRPS